jgi:hypothetical protein
LRTETRRKTMSTTTDERFWAETERLLSHAEPRETRQEREDLEFLRHLDNLDMERAADEIEELSAGYVEWRGFPLAGFESPRFLSEREREYKRWYRGDSPEAARVRRIREGR